MLGNRKPHTPENYICTFPAMQGLTSEDRDETEAIINPLRQPMEALYMHEGFDVDNRQLYTALVCLGKFLYLESSYTRLLRRPIYYPTAPSNKGCSRINLKKQMSLNPLILICFLYN